MKLLSVAFCNINSLAGVWRIDFTVPAYRDGIFLISGRTGAGKTSVFDAVTLALYGKTARQSRNRTSAGLRETDDCPYMTKGQRECWAEAVFQAGAFQWKSRFAVTRSAKKETLSRTCELARRAASSAAWQVCATGLDHWRKLVPEAVGLEFREFLRCVLLAQGSFSEFLRSRGEERAVILEGITGTEVYKEISRRIHEITRDKRQALTDCTAAAGAIPVLGAEQLKELRIRRQELRNIEADQKKMLDAANDASLWLRRKKQYQASLAEAREQLSEAQAADERFAENRKRLELARKARDFEPQRLQIKRVVDQLQAARQQQAGFIDIVREKTRVLRELSPKVEQAEANLRKKEEEMQQLEALLPSVMKLDAELAVLADRQQGADDQVVASESELRRRTEAVARGDSMLQKLRRDLAEAQGRMEKTEKDIELPTLFSGIQEKARALSEAEGSLSAAKTQAARAADAVRLAGNREREASIRCDAAAKAAQAAEGKARVAAEALESALAGRTQTGQMQALIRIDTQIALLRGLQGADREIDRATLALGKAEGRLAEAERNSVESDRRALQAKKSGIEMAVRYARDAGGKAERFRALRDDEIPRLRAEKSNREAALRSLGARDMTIFREYQEDPSKLERSLELMRQEILSWARQTEVAAKKAADARRDAEASSQKASEAQLALRQAQAELGRAEQAAKGAESLFAGRQAECGKIREGWLASVAPFGYRIASVSVTETMQRLDERRKARLRAEKDSEDRRGQLDKLSLQLEHAKAELEKVEKDTAAAREAAARWKAACVEKRQERIRAFGTRKPNEERSSAMRLLDQARTVRDNVVSQMTERHEQLEAAKAKQEQCGAQILGYEREQKSAEAHLDQAIRGIFASRDDFQSARREPQAIEKWEKEDLELRTAVRVAQDQVRGNEHKLEVHQALMQGISEDELEAQASGAEEANARYLDTIRESSAVDTELRADEAHRREYEEANRQVNAARAEYERWQELNSRIGSEDGTRFSRFAQSLTFRRLLHFANEELSHLTKRFVLEPAKGDPLDFQVVDNVLNCMRRSATNLSGGESFIVSLALALGLSRMSSDSARGSLQVDTVFLDEGFGTLDPEMLENALYALSQLREQGKLVGVISHIEEVGQKIPVQIRVTAGSVGGHNTLEGPGVSRG